MAEDDSQSVPSDENLPLPFRPTYLSRSRDIYSKRGGKRVWERDLYKQFLQLNKSMQIVDVGCGTGFFTLLLAESAFDGSQVTGIDLGMLSVKVASKRAKSLQLANGVSYELGDVYNLPLKSEIADLTCCRSVLANLAEPETAVQEMMRVTRPGGMVSAVEPGCMRTVYDAEDLVFTQQAQHYTFALVRGMQRLLGRQFAMGEALPGIFRRAGLGGLRLEVLADTVSLGEAGENIDRMREELQFELAYFDDRAKQTEWFLVAGGMPFQQIQQFFHSQKARIRQFLSDDNLIRRSTAFRVSTTYLCSGRRP